MTQPDPPVHAMSDDQLLQIEKLYLGDARPFSFGWRDVIRDLHAEVRRLRAQAAPGVVVPVPDRCTWERTYLGTMVVLHYTSQRKDADQAYDALIAAAAGPGER